MTVGGRGAAEISSCVLKYIKEEAASGVKELHIFSDSCWSQNKNQILFTMYSVASQKYGIKIVHRYLQKGHTQMECDSVHARIEKKNRNTTVFTPSVWFGHIQSAKVQRPMYTVIKVTQVDIVAFKDLAKDYFAWSKVPISKVHEIVVDCATPREISFKRKLSDEATVYNVLLKRKGRPFNWVTYEPPRLYKQPLALKPNLVKDLKWMMSQDLIPDREIAFYEKVTSPDFGTIVQQEGDEDEDEFPSEIAPVQDVLETINDSNLLDDAEEVHVNNGNESDERENDSDVYD